MQRNLWILPFVCFFLAAGAVTAAAQEKKTPPPDTPKDTITFVNGDKLTGTLERADAKQLTFKSDLAGEVTVGWDKVQDLKTLDMFAVLPKGFKAQGTRKLNNAEVPQGTITVAEKTVSVQQGMGAPVEIPVAGTEFIVDQKTYEQQLRGKPEIYQGWRGAVQAGVTLTRSTTDTAAYNVGFGFVRVVPTVSWIDPRTRTSVNFLDNYSKTTQTGVASVESSILHGDAEHDIYFTPKLFVLGNMQFDHNYSQGLSLQQIYGGGMGATLLKDPKQELDVKGQLQYEQQDFGNVPGTTSPSQPSQELISATFAEVYARKVTKTFSLTQQLQIIPAFNNTNAYSGNASVGLAMPLFKNFNFTVNTLDSYLNDPAPGAKKNTLQMILAIQYTIK